MATRETLDLLIEARWLLPIAPTNTVHTDHAVAVSAGRIVAAGPAAQLRARFEAREHVIRDRHALLPGLVNAHARTYQALLRGVPVRGPRRRWLADTVAPVEQRCLSADFVRDGTRLGMAEMLRAGITCFSDLSLFPDEAARAAGAAHMRAAIGLPVSDASTAWAEGATAHLAKAEALWDEYRSDSRIGLYFAALDSHGLSDATLTRVRRVADELDARVALHLEDLSAHAYALASSGTGVQDNTWHSGTGLARLAALGLLRPGFTAIGAGVCEPAELEILERHGACLIACPQAELRLGAEAASLRALESFDGARAALGSDSPAAAGALDILAEARLAALLGGLSAAAALRMVTLGGATVLGLQAQIGSIEPDKAADLICIELGAAHAADAVPDAILFTATRERVSDVWTAGRAAVSGGRLLAFDDEELAALPARWAQRLALEAAA